MKYVSRLFSLCLVLVVSTTCFAQSTESNVNDFRVIQSENPHPVQKSSYYRLSNQDEDLNTNRSQEDSEAEDDSNQAADNSNQTISQSFGPWPRTSIQETRIDIRETNKVVPKDRSDELTSGSNVSDWNQFSPSPTVFAWAAPDIRYQPLYFEDVALERYGQSSGLLSQPVRSGVNFFKSFVSLPNQMRHDKPGSCDHPLGFCRPGSYVPETTQAKFFGFSTKN